MNLSARTMSWIHIGVVCFSLSVSAENPLSNALEGTTQTQQPLEQPEFPIETFAGPGSSAESEVNKPFNIATVDPATVTTDASSVVKPTEETTVPTKAEDQLAPPVLPEKPDQRPDENKLPSVTDQESTGKLPKPIPSNVDLPPELQMSPLLQLLKAILSDPRFAMGGGMPLLPQPTSIGDDFGAYRPPQFGPPRFPRGGGRVARIVIMRRPRGFAGMNENFMRRK